MTTTRPRTGMQKELSNWLDEDVMEFITWSHQHDGQSYRQIAEELSKSGYDVNPALISSWVAAERNR